MFIEVVLVQIYIFYNFNKCYKNRPHSAQIRILIYNFSYFYPNFIQHWQYENIKMTWLIGIPIFL